MAQTDVRSHQQPSVRQWHCFEECFPYAPLLQQAGGAKWLYSSGHCSGIAPDSLSFYAENIKFTEKLRNTK